MDHPQDQDLFITKLYIHKVRHLEQIEIPLSDEKRKHLILTGKNGSGKTSVLLALRPLLSAELDLEVIKKQGKIYNFLNPKKGANTSPQEIEEPAIFPYFSGDKFMLHPPPEQFTSVFFPAKRTEKFRQPKGIEKIEQNRKQDTAPDYSKEFLQYIVNLKAERAFAKDDGETETVKRIDAWFERFEKALCQIFEDNALKLQFDRERYAFNIIIKNREVFDFNTLADGYSAILQIVAELIMRMEAQKLPVYDMQGIALIDEIEAHLHVDLQKKILPFLVSFFPKIQFIVSTHSPFVLTSLPDSTIYDLENRLHINEDISSLSYSSIVESYFNNDEYSEHIKEKIKIYEGLMQQDELSEKEQETLLDLKRYLKRLPKFMSPELSLKLFQLQS